MTLFYNRMLDALAGHGSKLRAMCDAYPARKAALTNVIKEAEVFDFGQLILEPGPVEGGWMVPSLTVSHDYRVVNAK